MDDPALDRARHQHALDALGRAHRVSRTAASLWPAIRDAEPGRSARPLRIADFGCGGGHLSLALARLAARARVDAEIVGYDISPVAVDYATALAHRLAVRGVRFVRTDVLEDGVAGSFDAAVSSLFLHHLDEVDAVACLNAMRRAGRRLVVVSDLKRTRRGYLMAWVGCRLLSTSRVFRTDGPRSVRAAWSSAEVRALALRAGLVGATLTDHWPERFVLTWKAVGG